MTEYEKPPGFRDDLNELARGRRQDIADFQPSAFVNEPDGTVQQTEGSVVGGGLGEEPETVTQVSGGAPPAPLDLEVVSTVGNGVIFADVTWNIDTTDPDYQSIVGWQVDWVPSVGGVTHRRTTQDTGLDAPDAPRTERIDPLLPSTEYTVRVRGVTAIGTPGLASETTLTTGELIFEDAEFRNVTAVDVDITGELDTSEAGLGTGFIAYSTLVSFYDAGVSPGSLAWDGGTGTIGFFIDNGVSLVLSPVDPLVLGDVVGVQVGAAGTPWSAINFYSFAYNPASVAANTTAVLTIPEATIGTTIASSDVVIYLRGLQGSLLFQGVNANAGDVSLRVRNVDSVAFDQGSTTFDLLILKR